jgi:hypothetical protein
MRIDKSSALIGRVAASGDTLQADFTGASGNPVSVLLPFDQAKELTTFLPKLLTDALRLRTQNDEARFVFALDKWKIEITSDSRLTVTMTSPDGFEVSFGMAHQECLALARALRTEAEWPSDRAEASIKRTRLPQIGDSARGVPVPECFDSPK